MSLRFGSSSGSSTSKPVDTTPAEFKELRDPFADVLQTLWGGTGKPASLAGVPEFAGPLAAPITQQETDLLGQFATSDPLAQARRSLLTGTLGGAYLPGQPNANPFLQAAIEAAQRPTLDALVQTLSRTLPGRFTQAGQFVQPKGSSAFDTAAAYASSGADKALADIASNMSFGAYESERGRQTQAIQLGQSEVDTTVKMLQASALPRLIQDLGIERGLKEFDTRIAFLLEALKTATAAPMFAQGQKARSDQSVIQGGFDTGRKLGD